MAAHDLAAYRQDVEFVVNQIEHVHPAPFAYMQKSVFERDSRSLIAAARGESLGCAIAQLMALVAELHDGHTYLDPVNGPGLQAWYPVRFYAFPDGLYVTSVTPECADLVGKRVVRIGRLSSDEAMSKVQALQAANNPIAALEGAVWLSNASIAGSLGAAVADQMMITVVDGTGKTLTARLRPFGGLVNGGWPQQGEMFGPRMLKDAQPYVTAFDGRGPLDFRKNDSALPPHLRYRLPYFVLEMPDANLIYFQWNFVENWGDEDFAQFTERLFTVVDAHPHWRLAIDVRYNSGGDGSMVQPFLKQIIRRQQFDEPGNLFVLTGRKTFSAAVDFVADAKEWTTAIVVGEPTGAGPDAYGDPQEYVTPGLHIRFQVSTAYHAHANGKDTSGAFSPDIPAMMRASDYFVGRDPVLDAIINGREILPLPALIAHSAADAKATLDRRRALWSGVTWYKPFSEGDMNRAGYDALRRGRTADAIIAFRMNADAYPDSWNVWDSLGEAQRANGDVTGAIESYKKSLTLYAGNENAKTAISEMQAKRRLPEAAFARSDGRTT